MKNLIVSASPHITNKANTTRRIMLDVIIALLPCVIAASVFFGWHVIINVVVCAATCFGAEMLFNVFVNRKNKTNKKSTAFDLSSIVTGIILALNLPAKSVVDAWNVVFYKDGFGAANSGAGNIADNIVFSFDTVFMCIIGSVFAIMVVKMLFGGIGKNFANPAVTARIFLVACFSLAMVAVNTTGFVLEASSGATWLSTGSKSTANRSMFLDMFLGNRGAAAAGETSMIAIILGFIYLSVRKVIDFRIPLIGIAGFMAFSVVFDGLIARSLASAPMGGAKIVNNMFANLMAGGFMFGLIFMATDYSTTPNTFLGHAIFVLGYALLTVLIRSFAGLPEGASFSILIMNIITPLLDRYIVPKPFGYIKPEKKKKAPKEKALKGEAA